MGRRLSNGRNEFYENNIAGAKLIIRRMIELAEGIDDPKKLERLEEVAQYAANIRDRNIIEMKKEKES